jgi:hypothetical protein
VIDDTGRNETDRIIISKGHAKKIRILFLRLSFIELSNLV